MVCVITSSVSSPMECWLRICSKRIRGATHAYLLLGVVNWWLTSQTYYNYELCHRARTTINFVPLRDSLTHSEVSTYGTHDLRSFAEEGACERCLCLILWRGPRTGIERTIPCSVGPFFLSPMDSTVGLTFLGAMKYAWCSSMPDINPSTSALVCSLLNNAPKLPRNKYRVCEPTALSQKEREGCIGNPSISKF